MLIFILYIYTSLFLLLKEVRGKEVLCVMSEKTNT